LKGSSAPRDHRLRPVCDRADDIRGSGDAAGVITSIMNTTIATHHALVRAVVLLLVTTAAATTARR
jgi:hypothetical protein